MRILNLFWEVDSMKFFRLLPEEEDDTEVFTFTSPLVKPIEFSDPLLYDDGELISVNLYYLKNKYKHFSK